MKKFLGLVVTAIALFIPFVVHAGTKLSYTCVNYEDETYTCIVGMTTDDSALEEFTVKVTEVGGAEVKSIDSVSGSDWSATATESGKVWTVALSLNAPGSVGEFDLFKVTYKGSGSSDCKLTIAFGETTQEITPTKTETKPRGKCVHDKDGLYYIDGVEVTEEQYKEECPKTGATLPYIALATLVVLAGAGYVLTKNKAKMYRL